jgi:hypothetical protein
MKSMSCRFVIAAALGLILTPGLAKAETYANLMKQGYKTGKLTQSKSGSRGWVVSKGDKHFFCRMNVATFYDGKTKMGAFTAAGRIVPVDKKVFESVIGGPDPSLPQIADLRAGRARPQDVGSCGPHR